MAEKIEFQISVSKDELSKALAGASTEALKTEQSVKKVKSALGEVGNELSRIKSSFVGNLAANLVTKGLDLVAAGFARVVDESREFSRAIAEINSTLPKTSKLTNDQARAIAAISERFGTSATNQAKGFFEVVSNGVEDTSKAFAILTSANNAALSGLVDINTATRLITSTFNAYSSQGVTAAEVTDSLVAVTQLSGAKFEELAQSMGRVTNVAAQNGVSLGELGGSIAFLNARSLTTEQAITGLSGIISDISKPTVEAAQAAKELGIEFNAAALKNKGLVGFLEDVTKKTDGNVSSLRRLFADQRSANAVLAIATSEFDKYRQAVDKVTNSQGEASRAASVIKESLDFKLSKAASEFNSLFIAIGEKLVPSIDIATKALALLRTELGGSPKSIDDNRNKLSELSKEFNATKDAINTLTNAASASDRQVQAAVTLIGTRAAGEARLNEILKQRAEILKAQSVKPTSPDLAATGDDPKASRQDDAIKREQEALFRIAALRAEFDLSQAQIAIEQKAQKNLLAEEDYQNLLTLEQREIDAKYAAETAKTQLIQDEQEKRIALEEITQKKKGELQKKEDARDKAAFTAKLTLERNLAQQRGAIVGQGFALAAELAKDGSKTQFLIQKAGALAQVAIARGTALAAIPAQVAPIPYPANLAAAAQLTTYANVQAGLGAAIIAASAIKGFANGGIIGATSGEDNRLATVRDGEMVLNADQQEKLFNAINNGALGGGEVVIQIDGKEIARAVRNQVKSGYKIA